MEAAAKGVFPAPCPRRPRPTARKTTAVADGEPLSRRAAAALEERTPTRPGWAVAPAGRAARAAEALGEALAFCPRRPRPKARQTAVMAAGEPLGRRAAGAPKSQMKLLRIVNQRRKHLEKVLVIK